MRLRTRRVVRVVCLTCWQCLYLVAGFSALLYCLGKLSQLLVH